LFPLSNSIREGELKGVSKNTSLTQFYNVKIIKLVKAAVPPPLPLSFSKERGDVKIVLFNCPPL